MFANELKKELSSIILQAWKNELNLGFIELDEDFFDIGGHSLRAINILDVFHKNAQFPVFKNLEITDLFEYTTINQLTDFLSSKYNEHNKSA